MKTKLSLTIDPKVIDSAKSYARKKGKSLSMIVEDYLRSITTDNEITNPLSSKVVKLMGSVKLPDDFDYKKELASAITSSKI